MSKALVVLSGGQDSTTVLFWAKDQFEEVIAISFDYGQKHFRELYAAREIARITGTPHYECVVKGVLDGRSPLTNPSEALETYSSAEEMDKIIGDRVEKTFVPMRNSLFLTIAANHAVCHDAYHLVTGVCQDDNANYPDCRPIFIEAQQLVINEALGFEDPTKHFGSTGHTALDDLRPSVKEYERKAPYGGVYIHAPLMYTPKSQAIQHALINYPGWFLAVAYSHTAYSGEYPPLTQDHATVLRAQGFHLAGLPDPLIIRAAYERHIQVPTTEAYEKYDREIDLCMPKIDRGDGTIAQAIKALEALIRARFREECGYDQVDPTALKNDR